MKLIIGGAYQGKRSFAMEKMGILPEEIYTCDSSRIDFTKPCIANLEEYVYACVREGKDALGMLRENKAQWENAVFLCQDLFCGVVPMGAELREWRQQTGIVCQYLSREAKSVHRIYCGLEQRLK